MARIALVIALLIYSASALAAPRCAPERFVKMVIETQFGEQLISTGTFSRGNAMRTYVNPATGTFTVLMILPDQQFCIIAAGKNFDLFVPVQIQPKTESP